MAIWYGNNICVEEKGNENFVIQNGKIIKKFSGELGNQNAKRFAYDLYVQEQMKPNYDSHLGWL